MEEAQQRKKRFVILLNKLLNESEGVKGKLALKLGIKPSTLTTWLQGKIDPGSLEVLFFERLAKAAKQSIDSLAQFFNIIETDKKQTTSQEQFKYLIEQILLIQSREQLAKRLGVRKTTIANWLNPDRNIHPENIPILTLAAIARERGWTIERLLAYLNLRKKEQIEANIIASIQSQTKQLSFTSRIKILSWLSADFEKEISNLDLLNFNAKYIINIINKKVLLVFEKENIEIASKYTGNLALYFQINPDNIEVTTFAKLSKSIENFDLLIFNIETNNPIIIDHVRQTSFNSDIVILTPQDLEVEVRQLLKDKVTDIVVMPIDWNILKDKPYFTST
ncbi:MAG: hypothetical protein ACFBSE_11245 [Prochloraceae cyanobacterium]